MLMFSCKVLLTFWQLLTIFIERALSRVVASYITLMLQRPLLSKVDRISISTVYRCTSQKNTFLLGGLLANYEIFSEALSAFI